LFRKIKQTVLGIMGVVTQVNIKTKKILPCGGTILEGNIA